MDSNSLKKYGFKNEWQDFKFLDKTIAGKTIEEYPGCRGVYVLRLKNKEKIQINVGDMGSDIVKIGCSPTKPLACRMWDYLNMNKTTSPVNNTRTAWKIRHFIHCQKKELKVAFICPKKDEAEDIEKKIKDIEKKMIGEFKEQHGWEKPLLEWSMEKYQKWCMKLGVDEETFKSEIGGSGSK